MAYGLYSFLTELIIRAYITIIMISKPLGEQMAKDTGMGPPSLSFWKHFTHGVKLIVPIGPGFKNRMRGNFMLFFLKTGILLSAKKSPSAEDINL
ncbi:MAG: hypothetical protein COB46_01145 [Rhodospirillaceae bacterium]|nr:MAG: hypothetical protein COB46_01145 [Rhodospirillaceae bacterium]